MLEGFLEPGVGGLGESGCCCGKGLNAVGPGLDFLGEPVGEVGGTADMAA